MLNKPPSGWASVVLAGMMLLTVAWSIEAAQPWPGIGILTPVVIGGVIVGAILGAQQRLPTGLCHAWSMVTGILTTVVAAAFAIHTFETAPAAALAQLSTYERMEVVRDWYLAWIELVRMPTPSYEAIQPTLAYAPAHQNDLAHLFFAVTMAMLIWLLSYICTWFIVRYMSWWGRSSPADSRSSSTSSTLPPKSATWCTSRSSSCARSCWPPRPTSRCRPSAGGASAWGTARTSGSTSCATASSSPSPSWA